MHTHIPHLIDLPEREELFDSVARLCIVWHLHRNWIVQLEHKLTESFWLHVLLWVNWLRISLFSPTSSNINWRRFARKPQGEPNILFGTNMLSSISRFSCFFSLILNSRCFEPELFNISVSNFFLSRSKISQHHRIERICQRSFSVQRLQLAFAILMWIKRTINIPQK